MKDTTIVGIGELACTRTKGHTLKTLALGSCVGVVITDPNRGITGMAHVVYPKSAPDEIDAKPSGYFADIAIKRLLDEFTKLGSGPRMGPMSVKLIGGAKPNAASSFNIGKKNVLAIKKQLFRFGLSPAAMEVGGTISRTVIVLAGDPAIRVTSPSLEDRVL